MAAKLIPKHVKGTTFDISVNAIGRHNDIDEHCEKKGAHSKRPFWRRWRSAIHV